MTGRQGSTGHPLISPSPSFAPCEAKSVASPFAFFAFQGKPPDGNKSSGQGDQDQFRPRKGVAFRLKTCYRQRGAVTGKIWGFVRGTVREALEISPLLGYTLP